MLWDGRLRFTGCLVDQVDPSCTVQTSTDLVPLAPLSSHGFANLRCQRCSVPRDGAQHQPQPSRLPAASRSHRRVLQCNITPLPGSSCTQPVPMSSEKAEKRLWNQPGISGLKWHRPPQEKSLCIWPCFPRSVHVSALSSTGQTPGCTACAQEVLQNASKPFFPI